MTKTSTQHYNTKVATEALQGLTGTTDEWLTQENLQDMASTLCICDFEMLVEVRKIWPVYALTAACKLLDLDTKKRIKEWVLEQNSNSTAAEEKTWHNPI